MGFIRRLLFTKSFAALVLAGFTCAYMVLGPLAGLILRRHFGASMPFIFILQGIGLAIIVTVLRDRLYDGPNKAKMSLVLRTVLCGVILAAALVLCWFLFSLFHTDWSKLWLIVAFLVLAGIVALFVLCELPAKPKPVGPDKPAAAEKPAKPGKSDTAATSDPVAPDPAPSLNDLTADATPSADSPLDLP